MTVRACLFQLAILLLTLGGLVEPGAATTVTPIHIEMVSTGSGSRAQFTVSNDGKENLPIEIGVERLVLDDKGDRKLTKAGSEFLVFPPQALIPPGGTQTFRLQWVGEPELKSSQSFMLGANQIPVKLPKGKSAVQVVMSFGIVVNVAPPKGVAKLAIVGTGIANEKSGKRRPTITVDNSSNVHGLLQQASLRVSGGGWSHSFSEPEMREKIGIGLVQPGKKRKFILPVDLPPNVTKVEATLDYKPKRN